MSTLDEQLLKAHEDENKHLLVDLYQQAADQAVTDDAKYFYLTHAYIYALEMRHEDTEHLKAQLIAAGRES